jgi:hypothetical protein
MKGNALIPFKFLHPVVLPAIKALADLNLYKLRAASRHPDHHQQKTLKALIHKGQNTAFGREHGFQNIRNHVDFKKQVPVMDYETLFPYIQRILDGEKNVLWPGRPLALASTSGTSKGPIKYIPVTPSSSPAYRKAALDSVLSYIAASGKTSILTGSMFFMSQNPEYERISGLPAAPISGVSVARAPFFVRKHILPSPEVACIPVWEDKLDAMLQETLAGKLTLISGIPPWLLLFFSHILQRTGKSIGEVFPDLKVIIHGGVNFEPYKKAMEEMIGRPVDYIETYAATEGFIAFQDDPVLPGMLMNLAGGMFFEFIPVDQTDAENPDRLGLADIEPDTQYAIALTTTAGLWAYDIGDTVKFISKNPLRMVVTGRTRHFISAFGEHVIADHVDGAMAETLALLNLSVREYSVAPCIHPEDGGLPHHDWFIEFETPPEQPERFAKELDLRLKARNIVYGGLVNQKIIRPLKIHLIRQNGFKDYMQSIGKIGGQNKVPRLLNHRKVADALGPYIKSRCGNS